MESNSTVKPTALMSGGKHSWLYRWNISETTATDEDGNEYSSYTYEEVRVYEPLSANKITAAVIAETWDSTYELKLANEYNAAQLGFYDDDEDTKQAKIDAYKAFLEKRAELKAQVDSDCAELGIE